MESAQDYKRAYDNDEGLNTGGMGTYSPNVLFADETLNKRIKTEILDPIIDGFIADQQEVLIRVIDMVAEFRLQFFNFIGGNGADIKEIEDHRSLFNLFVGAADAYGFDGVIGMRPETGCIDKPEGNAVGGKCIFNRIARCARYIAYNCSFFV